MVRCGSPYDRACAGAGEVQGRRHGAHEEHESEDAHAAAALRARPRRRRSMRSSAATCFPTAMRAAPARIRTGSTPCASTAASCGARTPIRRSRCRSRRGNPIWSRHDRSGRRHAAPRSVPSIPRDADGPVFREPWEAQAFAMALSLHERGVFTWSEWAAALGDEIKRAQAAGDPDTGETYYRTGSRRSSGWWPKKASPTRHAVALLRRLGPRRRSHAAWHADRVAAGRFSFVRQIIRSLTM